jgi:hypothetical protein
MKHLNLIRNAVRFINLTALALMVSNFNLNAQGSTNFPTINEDLQIKETILNSMRQSEKYWNNGNLEGFMHNYWKSDSLRFIGKSGITYGWESTLKRYKTSYPDKSVQGTLRFEFLHLEKISEDCWFQIGKYTLTREKDTVSGHFSLLWRKINGEWKIVADHSS